MHGTPLLKTLKHKDICNIGWPKSTRLKTFQFFYCFCTIEKRENRKLNVFIYIIRTIWEQKYLQTSGLASSLLAFTFCIWLSAVELKINYKKELLLPFTNPSCQSWDWEDLILSRKFQLSCCCPALLLCFRYQLVLIWRSGTNARKVASSSLWFP